MSIYSTIRHRVITLGIVIVLFLGMFQNAYGAYGIVFNASSTSSVNPGNSLAYALSCSGSDRIAFVHAEHNGGTTTTMSATYGGIATTKIGQVQSPSSNYYQNLFYLTKPPSSSNNVVVTTNDATKFIGSAALCYSGAADVQPNIISAAASSTATSVTSSTLTVTSATNNSWAIMAGGANQTISGNAISTLRREITTFDPGAGMFDNNGPISPAGATSTKITLGSSGEVGIIATIFAPETGKTRIKGRGASR